MNERFCGNCTHKGKGQVICPACANCDDKHSGWEAMADDCSKGTRFRWYLESMPVTNEPPIRKVLDGIDERDARISELEAEVGRRGQRIRELQTQADLGIEFNHDAAAELATRDAEIARLRTCAREMARAARGRREAATVAQMRSIIDTVLLRHRTRQRDELAAELDERAEVIVGLQRELEKRRGEVVRIKRGDGGAWWNKYLERRECPSCIAPGLVDHGGGLLCGECHTIWAKP